jgi:uncharacterized protein YbjT (DUF2867 family)
MARILITGGNGFLGRQIALALHAAGHNVVGTVRPGRRPPPAEGAIRFIDVDFMRDHDPAVWRPRLVGIDVVINAVGILRERRGSSFDAIHVKAPCALFHAAANSGVKLVIQISALGADELAQSRYHRSKREADLFLAQLAVPYVIVQPALVYGAGGTSARLFTALASMPLIPLPGAGDQRVQPIHLDDVIDAIRRLIETKRYRKQRVPLVGPAALSLRDFLARLRHTLGLGDARFLPVPLALVRAGARIGSLLPGSLLDIETLEMLQRGNTANAGATQQLLGHKPRPVDDFVDARQRRATRESAQLHWLAPLLRVSVAVVWIVTGIVSLGIYPIGESYALLARVGIGGWLAPVFLYGAALLDLGFGVATLLLSRRRWLWLAQMAVIAGYTAIITFMLPEYWLHPYGPILKNLPLLAVLLLLYELEER